MTVKMTKDGQSIFVADGQVAAHEALGWSRKKIEISADGQTLTIPAGTSIKNDVEDLSLEVLELVHYPITPAAASATAVHAASALGAATQVIATAITSPDVPRTVTIKGNVSGITGNVVVTGLNFEGVQITDTIALNGVTEVEGVKAFVDVASYSLPVQTHTPVKQVETATVVGTITGAGDAAVVVTAAGMTGSPKTINVAVEADDNAAAVAGKIHTALGADAAVTALFDVGGTDATVVLTRKVYAANDATLNISIDNGTCTGLTTAATSANTTAGVQQDTVSLGVGNKFGLPHIVANDALLLMKLFNGSADSGTLAVDADEIEKNLFAINGTPDGEKVLDLYYFV